MLHINKIHKEDHMYAAFSYFDKDGSGYITADELQQACDKFGLGDIHLDEVMSDIDKDNVHLSLFNLIISLSSLFILSKYVNLVGGSGTSLNGFQSERVVFNIGQNRSD